MATSILAYFRTSHHPSTLIAIGLVFFICVELLRRRRIRKLANPRNLPYPPGPKPLPIVGNIFDLTSDMSAYQQMAKKYGKSTFIKMSFGRRSYSQPKQES